MKWYAFITGEYTTGFIGQIQVRKFKTKEKMEQDIYAPYVIKHKGPFYANTYKEAFNKMKKELYN